MCWTTVTLFFIYYSVSTQFSDDDSDFEVDTRSDNMYHPPSPEPKPEVDTRSDDMYHPPSPEPKPKVDTL